MKNDHMKLASVAHLNTVRIAVYAPVLRYPTPAEAFIEMAVEIGDHPAIALRERVIDGGMDLGPDALIHQHGEAVALHAACAEAGICPYHVAGIIQAQVRSTTEAERISPTWLARQLAPRQITLDVSEYGDWSVSHHDVDGRPYEARFASLRACGAAYGVTPRKPA